MGAYKLTGLLVQGKRLSNAARWKSDRRDGKMFNRRVFLAFILPQICRFLGVNSVTNSDPHKGFLPVPIIRNEHWFEKFSVFQIY